MSSCVDPAALRAARERAGLTQHQLARLVGVAGGERVSRWELGTSDPRPELVGRLADVLGVPAVTLLASGADGPDLRQLRTAAGLSARALAEHGHVALPTLVRWEGGRFRRIPGGPALEALAGVLRVRVEDVENALERSQTRAAAQPLKLTEGG